MVRENAIPPKTLRETLGGAAGDESIAFGEALAHAGGMKPHFHAGIPHGHVGQEGMSKIADLPAAPMNVHAGTKISYFGDLLMNQAYEEIKGPDGKTVGVLTDWKGPQGQPCRLDVVKDLATKSNFSSLPPPFNLKSQTDGPHVTQTFVAGAGEGKVFILRGVGLKGQFLKMANPSRIAIRYLLEKLGCLQIRLPALTATAKPGKRSTERGQKQEGHGNIEKKGPKSNNRNQFMEFADRDNLRPRGDQRPSVKIYGWEEPRVARALRNHASGRVNAKRLSVWVLTLKDFEPRFINEVLAKNPPTLRRHGVPWIGKASAGKPAASKTLAFLMPMLEIDALEGDVREGAPEPSIATAKHSDFFEGEPAERAPPAVFGDGDLHEQDAPALKAFLNPSEAANNSYDNASEKRLVAEWHQKKPMDITIQQIMDLIAPSRKLITVEEDMKALLARAHVVVTTDTRVHFRLASDEFPEGGAVPFYLYSKKSKPGLFNYSPEARACFGMHNGDPISPNNYPPDVKEKAERPLNFAKRLMR
ncbi:unnamed protein product, partial [Prorocentrum cordatum]